MENAIEFPSHSGLLRGILHGRPSSASTPLGVVFLHGWSGNRMGPHRMFVHLARHLSASGIPCLRFDFQGRGESDGPALSTSIQGMVQDASSAISFLQSAVHPHKIILLGICSGGKVAIMTAAADPRVSGLALWSAEPMGYLRDSGAKARKSKLALVQYARKLLRPETWIKIISGRINIGMVGKAVTVKESADNTERTIESSSLDRFRSFRAPCLFIYGSNDPETRIAAGRYSTFCQHNTIPSEFHEIPSANHSFYSLAWETEVNHLTVNWLSHTFLSPENPS